jgi:hypothetical protein
MRCLLLHAGEGGEGATAEEVANTPQVPLLGDDNSLFKYGEVKPAIKTRQHTESDFFGSGLLSPSDS